MRIVALLSTAVIATATLSACTSEPPPQPPPAPGTTPIQQSGPTTPDRRPIVNIQITYEQGRTTPQPEKLAIDLGSIVDLVIHSDVDDQAVLNGLDLSTPVTGGSGGLQFTATEPGSFPLTLQNHNISLTMLQIR
jgi:hypothetical protein